MAVSCPVAKSIAAEQDRTRPRGRVLEKVFLHAGETKESYDGHEERIVLAWTKSKRRIVFPSLE